MRWTWLGAPLALITPACGGCGDDGSNDDIINVAVVATGLCTPFDAVPDPHRGKFYVTGLNAAGTEGGVYEVGCNSEPRPLAVGLNAPVGLCITPDGATLYVTDLGPENSATGEGEGGVAAVPSSGGTATLIDATRGLQPRGCDVRGDTLVFTGTRDGRAGVFEVRGNSVAPLYLGEPLDEPGGVTAARNSAKLYVADGGHGEIIEVDLSAGTATPLVSGLPLGFPMGLALTGNEQFLLVSGRNLATDRAAVYQINVATGETTTLNAPAINTESEAGGIHCSHDRETCVWSAPGECDGAGAGGTIYQLSSATAPLCP